MRIISQQLETVRPASGRSGVTLTEVLMSLMIMSIGVGLVATLFPIAALRSAQATKMTNGAITKLNVEAMITAQPEIIFDPDGDFVNSSFTSPNRWARITEHFRRNTEKNYIVDPSGYFANVFVRPNAGKLGPVAINSGDVNAVPQPLRGYCDFFGNTATGTAYQVLPRYDGGLRAQAIVRPQPFGVSDTNQNSLRDFELLAADISSLGDGWDTVIDEVAEGFIDINGNIVSTASGSIVGVKLSDDLDLSSLVSSQQYAALTPPLSIADPELTRITVFSGDGKISQAYALTAVNGSSCFWTEATFGDFNNDGIVSTRALPFEFLTAAPVGRSAPGRVLIETKRVQDFNWLLTVRRGPDGRARGVDVVVMFNNGRSPDDERVFPAIFTASSFGVVVAKTSGFDASGDPAEPFLKRGGWVLDVENARWYRIASYKEHPDQTGFPDTHLVTLESGAVQSSPAGGGGAIFIPGVVDVYPLGSIPLPENMTPLNF